MNDFDRLLELELTRMLDSVVRTPAPPRSSRPGRRPVVRLFTASASLIAPVATVPVLADGSRAGGGGGVPGAGFDAGPSDLFLNK
jgi:hypothetical protein